MTKIFQKIIVEKVVEDRMIKNLIDSGISKHQARQITLFQKQKKREAWKQMQYEVEQTINCLAKLGYTLHGLEAST